MCAVKRRAATMPDASLIPVPPEVSKFLTFGDCDDPDIDDLLDESRAGVVRLQKRIDHYQEKLTYLSNPANFAVVNPPGPLPTPEAYFARDKYYRIQNRYRPQLISVNAQMLNNLTVTSLMLSQCITRRLPVTCAKHGWESLREEIQENTPGFLQRRSRFHALREYVKRAKNSANRISDSGHQILAQLAERHKGQKDFFDSSFEPFLADYFAEVGFGRLDDAAKSLSPHLPPFEIDVVPDPQLTFSVLPLAVRSPRKFELRDGMARPPDHARLVSLCHSLAGQFTADSVEKQQLLRCALVDAVSDRLYLIDPILNEGNESLMPSLAIVRELTIADMQPPEGYFDGLEVKIGELVEVHPVMKQIAIFVEHMQFYRSPFALAHAISVLESMVRAMRPAGALGAIDLAFDDFFVVFLIVLTAATPSNAVGIARLFEVFGFLVYPAVLSHSVMSFCAWASYVENFLGEEHPPALREKITAIEARLKGEDG
jgi:hypothetical protein